MFHVGGARKLDDLLSYGMPRTGFPGFICGSRVTGLKNEAGATTMSPGRRSSLSGSTVKANEALG